MDKIFYAVAAQCPEPDKEDSFVIVIDEEFGVPLTTPNLEEARELRLNQDQPDMLCILKCEVIK